MERLGLNQGGYAGAGIDVDALVDDLVREARRAGWTTESRVVEGAGTLAFLSLTRDGKRAGPVRRVYLSAGIHGDEPAGPVALRRWIGAGAWPQDCEFWVAPCLNPAGFRAGTRANPGGIDLNRDYRHGLAAETRVHLGWLESLPDMDLTLCLHEDWEASGFYLYELNPDGRPSRAAAMIQAVSARCPIERAPVIDGRPAAGPGLVRPSINPADRPEWPEAFYLLQRKTRLSYTLEAPSDFPLDLRVDALVTAVHAALATD